jgi:hypothetical protein
MGRRLSGHVRNEVGAMIPSDREVEHARELLSRYFRPTRLASAESLAQRLGARVYLKIESDLPTGSFKPRGALNALLTTAAQRPVPGVVAASTGNHGAAVAYAARIAKVGVTIFLPENPNPVKRARIVALGAKVVELGAMGQSAASEGAAEFASEHGHYFLDDASDPLVPAGTATIASEILDEIPTPDVIFVPMMSHASRTTCHHLGAAHCVRAEPMGAPYNRGAHAHARVPLPPHCPGPLVNGRPFARVPRAPLAHSFSHFVQMNHLGSKVTPNLRDSRLASRCAALKPAGPPLIASSMNVVSVPMPFGPAVAANPSRFRLRLQGRCGNLLPFSSCSLSALPPKIMRSEYHKCPRSVQESFSEILSKPRFTREPAVGFEPTTC